MLMPSLEVAPAVESRKTLWNFLSRSSGIVWRSLLSASSSFSRSISARSCLPISMTISSSLSEPFPRFGGA
jgi:hypothetical protein